MEFAKYYNVSDIVDNMMEKKEIDWYPTGEDKFLGVYVCEDSNDFWISRILKGYNEEYERDDNMYLVERNKIDIYDVMDKLHELHRKKLPNFNEYIGHMQKRNAVKRYISQHGTLNIIKAVIILDDEDGLSNWDCCEAESLEEAIEIIDGGYGILRIAVWGGLMVNKIRVWVELSGGDVATVPEWVKTEEDLEKFADEYANNNISVGYELIDEQMDLDDFIEEIESAYQDAKEREFDSIVIAIDTDLDNTYYINDTEEGFQCDVFDYIFDDLYSIASQLYDEMHGNVTDIRVE